MLSFDGYERGRMFLLQADAAKRRYLILRRRDEAEVSRLQRCRTMLDHGFFHRARVHEAMRPLRIRFTGEVKTDDSSLRLVDLVQHKEGGSDVLARDHRCAEDRDGRGDAIPALLSTCAGSARDRGESSKPE